LSLLEPSSDAADEHKSICMLKPRLFLIQDCKCVSVVTSEVSLGYWCNSRIQKVFSIHHLKLLFAWGGGRVALAKIDTFRYGRSAELQSSAA